MNEISVLVSENALINQYLQPLTNFIDRLKNLFVEDATKKIALSFKYKCDNDIFLEKVFNMEINGIWFIDKVETSFPVYKAIMTSKNIYDIDPAYKIQLQCNTRMAAYILRKMESYFSSFYFSNIISSQRFYSRNGVLLKGSNLDVSLKRGGKPPPNKKAIDCFFDRL
ncbi:DUF6617 family protein [Pseudobacter ginsenosidimutans]|uniref:DUF6617 family protein n=1 Tax=Pseudobacter ginsenosidimutans TaxID=661488 RepID=UPI00102D93A0|nr:DUF6617 family protein [Pseudobacter ginsenosidimutans]QEC44411.1 hypothetical protein FSB84_23055 [Pseudobacter ginsenosidimutans]